MLGDAVVSVEDEHFYDNFVVNVADGAGRAALGVLQTNRDPGGSTIDQQLAKQLYGVGDGLVATLKAIALGVKLSLELPEAGDPRHVPQRRLLRTRLLGRRCRRAGLLPHDPRQARLGRGGAAGGPATGAFDL